MTATLPSLPQLAADLRDGKRSSHMIVSEAVKAHERSDLGAYKSWNGDAALGIAQNIDQLFAAGYDTGALMGLPCSVKDLYLVPGQPVFAGSSAELDLTTWQVGPVITELMAQLGVVMGKTHTVEFAFGGIGTNPHWPVPRNPWGDGGRIPGGSSSGAGVSLVEGSALFALGTDTAGSVRIPASVTGTVGLKLTHGRWSLDGIVPLSPSFDSPGILCRTAEDVSFVFDALDPCAGPMPQAEIGGMRLGVLGGVAAEGVDDDIAKIVADALSQIERRGAVLSDRDLPYAGPALDIFRQGGLAASELAAFLETEMPGRVELLDPKVRLRIDAAAELSAVGYLRRRADFTRFAAATAQDAFTDIDFLVCPTIAISPPTIESLSETAVYASSNMNVLRNTAIGNLLRLCSITLPVGLDRNGMPVGLMLMGPPMAEERLIAAAVAIERLLDFRPRHPVHG